MSVSAANAVLMEVAENAVMEVTVTTQGWILETLATCDRKMP